MVAARMMRQQARQEAELQLFFAAAAGCLLQHKKRRCSRKPRPGQEPGQGGGGGGVLIDGSMLMVESGSYETILQVVGEWCLLARCLPTHLRLSVRTLSIIHHTLSTQHLSPLPFPVDVLLCCHTRVIKVLHDCDYRTKDALSHLSSETFGDRILVHWSLAEQEAIANAFAR